MSTATSELLAVQLGQTTAYAYALSGKVDQNGTVLDLAWKGVPNRNPSESGDFVALWQNNGSLPWGVKPLNTQQVTNATPDGDLGFTNLQLAKLPYVAAYSVGTDNKEFHNVAAVLPVSVGGINGPVQAITVTVAWIGATSLTVDYTAPNGAMPKTFGHSLVLVRGETYVPGTSSAIATTSPTDNSNDGAVFGGVTMVVGQVYTVAYLAGKLPTNVAATVTFQVS
jgi:hypothetical protein